MSHAYEHAENSARLFGGSAEDYLPIHQWFDAPKAAVPNFRSRALRHHGFGIFEAERIFGATILNSDDKVVPVRIIAEQHVREDCGGRIPSVEDWLHHIPMEPWMIDVELLQPAEERSSTNSSSG